MKWQQIKPSDGRLMPWKNGGGTTLELAVDPPGATVETGFRWRLSSAEVAASGPFSAFPGLERWLLLLEGAGFDLDFGPRGRVALTEPLVPIRFSGDWPATATLVDGPSTDFNLMVDPRCCQARVESFHLASPRALAQPAGSTLIVFVAGGTVYVPEVELHLGRRHLLRMDDAPDVLQLIPGYGGATLVVVELRVV
ncbi:HutD/Ves family protein [Geothrix campi]|uniref:HutD/Ves family protein n=1 Tax=Geothrix campi TaxID=2966450 RepID=UPI002148BE7C|nr:HutD family protein [Geothrix sp. SG10]